MASSKFYAAESSSDTEDSSSSDNETPMISRSRPSVQKIFLPSDDEEEKHRVVRSGKEKRWEGLQNIIKLMQNAKKIRDMSKLADEFDNLTKLYTKSRTVIAKEGIPRFYIRCLAETEDYINDLWADKDARKKMSKLNSKSLGALRQKLRKYMRDFEKEVAEYKLNPDVEDTATDTVLDKSMSDEEKGVPEETDGFLQTPAKIATFTDVLKDGSADESDDDDIFNWTTDDDDDSSSDESEEGGGGRVLTAEYFLKKSTDKDDAAEKAKKKERVQQREARGKKKEEDWEEVKRIGKAKVTLFDKDTEITHAVVMKKLSEITLNRGRRSTVRKEQVDLLKQLRQVGEDNNLGPAMTVRITFDLVSAFFDYNTKILDCMKSEPWNEVVVYIEEILDMLEVHQDITVAENISQESENVSDKETGYRICGSPVVLVEKLHAEYIKILQNCDAHSTEFVKHLRDESKVINAIKKLRRYVERIGSSQNICSQYMLQVEYIYYKYDPKSVVKADNGAEEGEQQGVQEESERTSTDVMKELCQYIYTKDSSDRLRTRAILHHIYHHCLHDRWYEARDLMLMSHLQETIHFSDVPTQIIYNRTMVQLGLCAFRQGLMKEAHNALVDIQSTGRAKELLAQGLLLQRQGERITPEQEKVEKRRQIPFHMHINLELLECVYLVSAMLLEIPYVAAHEFDARRRMISKQFHHQLRVSERQSLLGPPDNMREHVVAAAKALKMGDYRTCLKFIINDKMNNKVWNLFNNRVTVVSMLETKIKEESLCTYLSTYSQFYDSISLHWLSSMFELDKATCHRIISRLIINEELSASWDEPSSSLVLHRTDPTRLQNMAIQLAEKVSTLVDINERILEARAGGGFQSYRPDTGYQSNRYQGNRSHGYQTNRHTIGYQGNRSSGYQGNRGSHYGGYRKDMYKSR